MESKIRSRYVTPQLNMNWWKVEIDSDCLTERDGQIKKAGSWFSNDEMKNVEALTVFDRYSKNSDPNAFSKFSNMSGFENLKFLSIPLDLMNAIDVKGISKNIEYISISRPRIHFEYWEKNNMPVFFEENLPKIKWLQFRFSPKHFKNFKPENFPLLEFAGMDLDEFDKTGIGIKIFDRNEKIEAFSINVAKAPDVLKRVRKNIQALDMWAIAPRKFDFSYISSFKDLKYLRLSGSTTTFDFSMIKGLENLEDIEIGSFQSVVNLEAVCEVKSLKRVHVKFLNDKSPLSVEMKMKIQNSLPGADISLGDV